MKLTKEMMMKIHYAIHGFDDFVALKGTGTDGVFRINIYKNGCRYCDVGRIRFMEQNRSKSSEYAKKARDTGVWITWGQREPEDWIYIETPPQATNLPSPRDLKELCQVVLSKMDHRL